MPWDHGAQCRRLRARVALPWGAPWGTFHPPGAPSDTEPSRLPVLPPTPPGHPQAAAPDQPQGSAHTPGDSSTRRARSPHTPEHPPRPGHPLTPQLAHSADPAPQEPPSPGTPPPPGPRIPSSPSTGRAPAPVPVPVPSLTAAPPPRPSAPRSRPASAAASPRSAPARSPLASAHVTPCANALIGRSAEHSIGCGAVRVEHGASLLAEREVGGAGGERAVTCPSGLAGPGGSRGRKRADLATWAAEPLRGAGGGPAREHRAD